MGIIFFTVAELQQGTCLHFHFFNSNHTSSAWIFLIAVLQPSEIPRLKILLKYLFQTLLFYNPYSSKT